MNWGLGKYRVSRFWLATFVDVVIFWNVRCGEHQTGETEEKTKCALHIERTMDCFFFFGIGMQNQGMEPLPLYPKEKRSIWWMSREGFLRRVKSHQICRIEIVITGLSLDISKLETYYGGGEGSGILSALIIFDLFYFWERIDHQVRARNYPSSLLRWSLGITLQAWYIWLDTDKFPKYGTLKRSFGGRDCSANCSAPPVSSRDCPTFSSSERRIRSENDEFDRSALAIECFLMLFGALKLSHDIRCLPLTLLSRGVLRLNSIPFRTWRRP